MILLEVGSQQWPPNAAALFSPKSYCETVEVDRAIRLRPERNLASVRKGAILSGEHMDFPLKEMVNLLDMTRRV
jgi:hypothetical protein